MTDTELLNEVRRCRICAEFLPHEPRPVFQIDPAAKMLIVGQAPGRRVHETGVSFNDPSGERLRDWMGIGREQFYNPQLVALLPMGLCYPGKGASGDLPPRMECQRWRKPMLGLLPRIELTLLIGLYAQKWHLGDQRKATLRETVREGMQYGSGILALPHPSPRNRLWLRKNPWFEEEILPLLRARVQAVLSQSV